ncbi:MAG: D-alanine--D-alanine ligase [Candidatus Brocadiaceae bacterium]|nr:D-alanine--D-alanine ligase [Candidatus Brocadiaceae bacterium]
MNRQQRLRVAVLMGGPGGERAVSLKSGRAVADALQRRGHAVLSYDVTGRALPGLAELQPDVAFLALHGAFGEDGTVQQMLDELGIPYTGSGPEASRIAMDKVAAKQAFRRSAIPTPEYLVLEPDASVRAAQTAVEELGYPVVCKPAAGGSSLGVSIVRHPNELAAAVDEARPHGGTILIERYVRGREFTVGILEGEALPMIELVVRRPFFDYSAKYEDEGTHYVCPVALLPTLYRKACRASVDAYEALGCRHMARVDLLHGYDGSLTVLELNSIPGLTPRSLLPMAAEHAGIEFPDLCETIVRAALRDAAVRAPRRLSA